MKIWAYSRTLTLACVHNEETYRVFHEYSLAVQAFGCLFPSDMGTRSMSKNTWEILVQ